MILIFPESLDEALLQRVVVVVNEAGEWVDGVVEVSDIETRWAFSPSEPWVAGSYRVEIETILEDLAGNSIARPFEVEQRRSESYRQGPKTVSLSFKIE